MRKNLLSALLLGSAMLVPSIAFAEAAPEASAEPMAIAMPAANQSNLEKVVAKMPKISGYIQTGYNFQDKNNTGKDENTSSFQLKRMRLIIDSKLNDMFDIRAQFEMFSSSKDGNKKAVMTVMDAFVNMHIVPGLHFRAGQFFLPVGFENYDISPATNEFVDFSNICYRMACRNAIATPGIIDYGRDLGIMAYGDLFKNENKDFYYLSYNLAFTNGQLPNMNDNDRSKDITARLTFRPVKNLRINASYQYGEYDTAFGDIKVENINLHRVVLGAWYNDPTGLTARSEWGYLKSKDTNLQEMGFYVMAGYHFGKWLPAARFEMYRDHYNKLARTNKNNILLGVTYEPYKFLKFQVNYTMSMYTDEIKDSAMKNTDLGHQLQIMAIAKF